LYRTNILGYHPDPRPEAAETNLSRFVDWSCGEAWRYVEAGRGF
jgi:hypothetical protein